MQLTRTDLQQAIEEGVLTAENGEALWRFLAAKHKDQPSFQGTHILYYLGGMLAIGAISLFMTQGWVLLGGWGLFAVASILAVATTVLTHWFLHRKQLLIPAGILLALTVVLVPLAVFGVQRALGYWDDTLRYQTFHTHIDWRWLVMELATLLAGVLLLWRMPLPFAVMPVAVTLWYMSMDLVPLLTGHSAWTLESGRQISLLFGLGMLLTALWVDLRQKAQADYAFWLYLFGMITFWCGLSLHNSDSEWSKFFYFCINLLLLILGGLLRRRVFAVFAGLGMAGYLAHLSHRWFADSLLFPFILILLGFALLYLGMLWQRHGETLTARHRHLLPQGLQRLWER
ncbi:MAG: DUF2157 domain-containing protein [Magnetococcales bacterium]|nr:DUF2157 domain-containing protein [Magnetococcales bacterium]